MRTPTLVKQPSEDRLYAMDFASMLGVGETIVTVDSVTATPDDGEISLDGAAVASGTEAQQRISGGVSGVTYKVTFVVTTSADNVLEGEGNLQVRNL
jgi:hypothetical protein